MKQIKTNTERFTFISDAKKYQAKKRKEGFNTKLIKHAGCAHPFSEVVISKK